MMQAWVADEFGEDRKDRGKALQKLSSVEEGAAETQGIWKVGSLSVCRDEGSALSAEKPKTIKLKVYFIKLLFNHHKQCLNTE